VDEADFMETKQTEKLAQDAAIKVGMPNITNFTEKRNLKMIYELKDEEVKTYSYLMDMHGKLHFLCNSIGYGIPFSAQYSNPQKVSYSKTSYWQMPQSEPNGLFMPTSSAATYVLCTDGKGKIHPVYSESDLTVSPFPLKAADKLQ
ncbi:MAG: hypothetical protein ACOC1K_04560, partial [Nanoarchaeota archaeon]